MRQSLRSIAFALAFVLTSSPAFAAIDAYLQIDGIKGESPTHPGWIEVSSFQWGAGRGAGLPTGGAAGREASAPSVSEVVVTKTTDSASPFLMKCAASGCHYKKVTLAVRKAGGEQLLTYILTDVMVSGYHVSGSSGGDRPQESMTLNFAKMELQSQSAPRADMPVTSQPTGLARAVGH